MAVSRGFRWLALEEDDYRNDARIPEFVVASRARGLLAGVWQTQPTTKVWSGIDFYIAELERPIDTVDFARRHRVFNPTLRSAFITNLDTHGNPDYFKPLVDAGFAGITEAYVSDNPQATPEAMAFQARQVGIPDSQPCISLYEGRNGHPSVADYGDLSAWPGWSVYLAEHL